MPFNIIASIIYYHGGAEGSRVPAHEALRLLMRATLPLAACALLAGGAAGCGRQAVSPAAAAEEQALYIYNWADYIGRDTVAEFERQTGIKVVYDTYDSDETLEARMMAGDAGYDIVSTAPEYFSRQIKAGIYRPLDRSQLPGWENLDPRSLEVLAWADPGNRHAMPYMHAINGFAYNIDMIRERMPDAPVDSLDMIFKPEVVARFADCGVTLLDSPEDVLQLALNYLHLDPNTTRPEDYHAAEQLVLAIRPYIRTFDSSEYTNGLANREICIAMSWSADYAASRARAAAAGIQVNLAFTVPREGANETFSALLIPKDAPHPHAAHRFLNFILQPRVIAGITNQIHYANDNRAADPFVDQVIRDDPALYPTPEIERRLYHSGEISPAIERIRTRAWTRIKTAH